MKADINTNGRAFQFQFDLEIQKIKLFKTIQIPRSSYLEVVWRRGQKNISTKIKPQVKGNQEQVFFGETLSMISTCLLNNDSFQFNPKQSTVSVVIYISGSQKLFGSININLCSVLNSKNYHERGIKYIEQQLNGRTKSKIFLKLSSSYLKQMMKSDDQQSVGSGVHSTSYNNTSNYSIVQRRTIDIPSKDTYSVLSYGGSIRYSNKKQQNSSIKRDQSAKKIEQQASKQYGRFGGYGGYTQTNFYSKPINQYNLTQAPQQGGLLQPPVSGLTQNNSNIRSVQSIQSSATRQPRNTDSDPNKSSVGQQNSRLLIEQQTKRSKLQAEVNKNKVENDELKNKLTEYVRENMKLKEQLKKFYENNDSRQAETKKQNEQLKERNYVLANQIRQLKVRFDKYINLEKECMNLKNEKQNFARESRKNEQFINHIRKQLEQTKSQLYKSRQNQSKLFNQIKQAKNHKSSIQQQRRDSDNRIKQLTGQLQYYQNNSKSLSMLLRQAEQKYKNIERDCKSLQSRFEGYRCDESRKIQDAVSLKQRQIKQLNERLNLKNQQCTRYILQAQKTKNQYGKLKDEKIAQYEVNKNKMTLQIQNLSIILRQANMKVQNLNQQKNSLNNLIRSQSAMRAKQSQKIKQLQDQVNHHQRQKFQLKKSIQQMQMENVQLNKLLSEKARYFQEARSHKEQIQNLMKQNLQLELQIKYKNQEVMKNMRIQEEHESLKCKFLIHENNIRQLNEALDKSQKQLKQRNRSYILQCQKSKMMIEQRVASSKALNQVKQQLQNAKNIIANGQKQFKQMDYYINDLQSKNKTLSDEVRRLEQKLGDSHSDRYKGEIKFLQNRNKQLEMRDSQKIKSIQNLNKNLNSSNRQIKQLQMISQQRYQQSQKKDKVIADLENKIKELQSTRGSVDSQLNTILQQKKSLAKKNEMIMDELFSYKRKLEQEKGRSHSTVHIRTSQDYIKIKNMQNQLQKKDQKIRKMEKEMIALQNENVNLSIQVMKKLEDITPH